MNENNDTQVDSGMQFTAEQIRVLGCLIEKEICTPEYYPLTLKSLMAACNQKSNRDPVMMLDDSEIVRIIEDLRYDHQIVRQVTTAGSRVAKFKHMFPDHFDFTPQATAVLCELFLRGPQTVGQLRTHTARLYQFADINEVEETLTALTTWEDGPFVVKLPREPGCREQRWAHLFSGEIEINEVASDAEPVQTRVPAQHKNERIEALESEVEALREQLTTLQLEFAEFRKLFE